jgi:hypothetical protein
MSADLALVREALQATTVDRRGHGTGFGRALGWSEPARRAASPKVRRARLLQAMRYLLYAQFYCTGRAEPLEHLPWNAPPAGDPDFVQRLSEANSGDHAYERGWTVRTAAPGRTVVERAGLQVRVRAADIVDPIGAPLKVGSVVAIAMRNELRQRSPGFYIALGGEDLEGERSPIVRLYWNLRSQGAPVLVRTLTTQLRAAQLPYRLKVLNAPMSFIRCDAAVMYVSRRDYQRVPPIVAAARLALDRDLKPRTPAMTKQLAPGLGLAEEPSGGQSFGLHRCTLLAEGILQAHHQGVRSLEGRLDAVAARFADQGLRLTAPYLNRDSTDIYAPLPITEART